MPDETTTLPPPNSRSLDEMRGPAAERPVAARGGARFTAPPVAPEAHMPRIRIGSGDLQSWEFTQRVARGYASSTLVPEAYRLMKPRGKFGKAREEMIENPAGLPNCIIALNMAERLGADPLMVMQNLYIVEGRPSWSAQFVISAINSCGRYSALQYQVTDEGVQTVDYEVSVWDDAAQSKVAVKKKAAVPKLTFVAWAIDKETKARLESPPITMEMAVLEGWYDKPGSKWKTMPLIMGRYRAASFFGRTYCPEILMGLRTQDEEMETIEAEMAADGSWGIAAERPEAQPAATPAQIEHEQVVTLDLSTDKPAPDPAEASSAAQQDGEKRSEPPPAERRKPSAAQIALQAALARGKTDWPADFAPTPQQADMHLRGDPQPSPPERDDDFGSGE